MPRRAFDDSRDPLNLDVLISLNFDRVGPHGECDQEDPAEREVPNG
jgi:hypothetical protein